MERKYFCIGERVSLVEYLPDADDPLTYENWLDPVTQEAYNFQMKKTYEEYHEGESKHRWNAVILRNDDRKIIGSVTLSPEGSAPDLAINLFRTFRGLGYGTEAFSMALKYCFNNFGFTEVYAGCYEHNAASRKMLEKCGLRPNPEGNCEERHFLTGEPVVQFDFVKYRE